ncbi:MAG: hypothetical protein IPJ19_16500 [Planctomycetes bacterium]|nr:hypothetical protein [Planctomycetota bacterium]
MGKDYTTMMVWLNDGRFVNGILKGTTDLRRSTLQTDTVLVVIEKGEDRDAEDSGEAADAQGASTTPKGEVRDLVAYLQIPQGPLRDEDRHGAPLP